jgi:hypothetical protein
MAVHQLRSLDLYTVEWRVVMGGETKGHEFRLAFGAKVKDVLFFGTASLRLWGLSALHGG